MRTILAAFCMLSAQFCFSQRTVDVTNGDNRVGQNALVVVSGTPFVNEKYVSLVEGSPYFSDEWLKGVMVGLNGQEYKGLSIKLDLIENQIHYKDEKGNELITTTPIKEVVLTDALGNNYKFIYSSSLPETASNLKKGWYLWLCSGTASLYKYYDKSITEHTPYNSATVEQKIKTSEKYLVLYNNAFMDVKKLKDAPAVLANKKAEVEDYLKNRDNKDLTMDDRFLKLIEYYNSLFTENK
jgi:hypothetical protein